jgi:PBSX family phage terminase large subunit
MAILRYEPRGAARELFLCRDRELVLDGPAGTGKSRAILHKLLWQGFKYPNARLLMVRKTRKSLSTSGMITFEQKVEAPKLGVRWHTTKQEYQFPNGSVLAIAGIDDPEKIKSSEWDTIYVQEATEVTLDDWESLSSRQRNGIVPYAQLIGDTNPGPPTHWLNQRMIGGQTKRLLSHHEDNPLFWDATAKAWTQAGRDYVLGTLANLTGVRKLRLYQGVWAAAEGMVYDGWNPATHVVDRFPVPKDWQRIWVVDFGFTNPFVWQEWARDPDGRLYLVQEIYWTQRLVEDHADAIRAATKNSPRPIAIVCDHDAEDRATLERKLGLKTLAAEKTVSPGIQTVASRLKVLEDGKPRIFLMRDAALQRDPRLKDAGKPVCTEEEFDGYVWDLGSNRKKGDQVLKENDHGMDALRYACAYCDFPGKTLNVWKW